MSELTSMRSLTVKSCERNPRSFSLTCAASNTRKAGLLMDDVSICCGRTVSQKASDSSPRTTVVAYSSMLWAWIWRMSSSIADSLEPEYRPVSTDMTNQRVTQRWISPAGIFRSRSVRYRMYAKSMAICDVTMEGSTNPVERMIIMNCLKLVSFMNSVMPAPRRANESSTVASSFCLVSKLRPESRATRSCSLPRRNMEVNATRSMSEYDGSYLSSFSSLSHDI